MATSEGIKQRVVEKPPSGNGGGGDITDGAAYPDSKDRKIEKAKRRLPTLVAAVAIPAVLSAASAYLSGTKHPGVPDQKPTGFQPSILAFHLGNIVTAALASLAAWLFWAKGGFHQRPTDLLLYLGQLLLGLAWGPVVLRLRHARLGLAIAVAMLACLFGCSKYFRRVNHAASDLVVPCMAWALFLAMFTYRLM